MKFYIREWTEHTVDGEELTVVQVVESKPNELAYIVFLEK